MQVLQEKGRNDRLCGLSRHGERSVFVPAPVETVFAYVDDHMALSSHMRRSSWKMGGGKMKIEMDAEEGKRVGSRIRLAGRVFGIRLWVDEVVIEREPPYYKVWETIGQPRLLVIGRYRMGFRATPQSVGSLLRVFIDYDLPGTPIARLLGHLLGRYYANWCTRQLAFDAREHFSARRSV